MLTHSHGHFSGELYFRVEGEMQRVSSGECRIRSVMLPGFFQRTQVWDCAYETTGSVDLGFDRLVQSAYDAPSYQVDGLDRFTSGSIFINRAIRDGEETVTYEYWTRPAGDRFTYQLWQENDDGDPQPWMSGAWIRVED